MTYSVRQETDGSYSVACDGYTIASGLTHAEVQDLLGELERVEAEMEARRRVGDAFSGKDK